MRTTLFLLAALALTAGASLAPAAAANWRNPYGNIDHRNDAGNDTGDSQVDSLNAAQLDQNYWRTHPQGGGGIEPGMRMPSESGPALGGAPPP